MNALFYLLLSIVAFGLIFSSIVAYGQTNSTNTTNEMANLTINGGNMSAVQNAGNNLENQIMCASDPSYCKGGLNNP
jgi:hypothetical protein